MSFIFINPKPFRGEDVPMDGITMETVLLQLLVLFLLAKVAGLICERIKISPVIGEIFAGILVGNTILFHWLSLDLDMSLFENWASYSYFSP
jgi:NhaP-type Na+/H+ or K+/H+ antiporter